MPGFYLFVLWLSDEQVSVVVVTYNLSQAHWEGVIDWESVFVLEKTRSFEKQPRNMCIK